MKKLLIASIVLLSGICVRAESYINLQHFTVIPDTITISNDYYYRGTFRITSDTFTVRLDSAPSYTIIFTTLAATINLPTTINSTLDVTGTLAVDGVLTVGTGIQSTSGNITVKEFAGFFVNNDDGDNTGIKSPNTDTLQMLVLGNLVGYYNSQSAVIKTSTTAGLNGTTPIEEGETYWNINTNELWIATGTAINQFIHK